MKIRTVLQTGLVALEKARRERALFMMRMYWLKNKDRLRASRKAWRDANKERISAYNRAYKEKNRARINAVRNRRYALDRSRREYLNRKQREYRARDAALRMAA